MTSYADQFIPPPRRAARWTKERPTKPGWYWWRGRDIEGVAYVAYVNGVLSVVAEDGDACPVQAQGEWAGPIPEPEETT